MKRWVVSLEQSKRRLSCAPHAETPAWCAVAAYPALMQTASSMGPQLAGVESQPLEELLRVRSRVRLPDGRRLCYRFWGHPLNSPQRAKRTILYMHGWPSSRLEVCLKCSAAQRNAAGALSLGARTVHSRAGQMCAACPAP